MSHGLDNRLVKGLGAWLLLAVVLGVWWAVSHSGWISSVFLPTPEATLVALRQGWSAGQLTGFSAATVERMLAGWALASLVGVALGAAIGSSALLRALLQPLLEFLRPLPASAVLPLAIALLGLGPRTVLLVVVFGALWPVLLATVHGFADVHPRLREVALCFNMSRFDFVWKLGLPNALPDILSGMRLSMSVSLMVAVVGEMLASEPGLGQTILTSARSFRGDQLYAGIVLLGAIGFGSNWLLSQLETRLLRWQSH